jgi:hypothetical protein
VHQWVSTERPRSHIALFEKTLRDDGKEVANNAEGNIVGKRRLATDEYLHFQSTDEFEFLHPRSLLKLNNIYLYKKDVY